MKVIRLESERTQWEQRYLEESAMRQVAIDAASIPKDAKIAVLEKSSAESEKMIAEARSDKLKQTAEIQQTQKRMSDMEYQIKALEKELSDRDSIIKILQKSAYHGKPGENVLSIPIQDTATSPMMIHSRQVSHSPLSQVSLLLHLASVLVHCMWSRATDPDNSAIPYLTATGDLLGGALLAAVFLIIQSVE